MNPDKYQQAVIDEYARTNRNIFVSAAAGAGKTTLLVELSRRTPPTRDSIFLAFNKSIANELANRLPPDRKAQTLHSCALGALRRAYRLQIDISENKYFQMALNELKWPEKLPVKQKMSQCGKVARLYDLMRVNCLYGDEKAVFELGLRYGEEVSDTIVSQAIRLHAIATQFADRFFFGNAGGKLKMDFTDMLTYAIKYVPKSEFKQYSVVMTDEIQDLNPLQYQLIQRLKNPGGRLIAVGDERQCQPAGTKILMDDGSEKNIEDIQIGETVVTYSSSRGTFLHHRTYSRGGNIVHRGCKVLAKEERYTDKTIRIRTSSGKESEYSFEHICYAKLDYKGFGEVFCTYLMEDAKGRFRVGKTNIKQRGKQSGFGLKMRMRHEGCIKAWILDTFDTDRDAYLMEQIVSYKFGIPQICFSGDEEEIDLIYSCIPDIKNRAIQCLTEFHRLIDYPFVKLNDDNHYSRLHSFTINACNLLPKIMQVNVFYENNKKLRTHGKNGDINYTLIGSCYETIEEVRLLQERKKVYSLEIEKEHNYVADKILTHNCIYSFQGSNLDTLNAIKNAPNTVSLPLSMTYRCAKAIVEEALTVFPDGIEAAPFAKDGTVREGDVYEAQIGDFVLCRNNAPLVDAFIGLLKQGKRAQILGKEFGNEVIELIDSVSEIWDLEKKLSDFEERLRAKGITNPMKVSAYSELDDRVNVLISLYLHFGSLDKVRQVIQEMFTDKPDFSQQVTLSTIHKSKGLEANRVFFLNPELIPSKFATSELELYAEDCLKFVAITRAKNSLIYCHIGNNK